MIYDRMIELMIYDRCIWMNEYTCISNVNGEYAINEWTNVAFEWMNNVNGVYQMKEWWYDNDARNGIVDLEMILWIGNLSLLGIFWWNNAKQGGLSEHQTDNWWLDAWMKWITI